MLATNGTPVHLTFSNNEAALLTAAEQFSWVDPRSGQSSYWRIHPLNGIGTVAAAESEMVLRRAPAGGIHRSARDVFLEDGGRPLGAYRPCPSAALTRFRGNEQPLAFRADSRPRSTSEWRV